MLKPKNPIAAVEADLAALEKRRIGLDARRATAAAAAQAATAARRALLVDSDDPSAADLGKADRACREAADAEGAAVDALAEVDTRITAARERLAGLREVADRERRAVAIEASAAAADKAVERMRRAAGELNSARRDLAAALLPEAVAAYAPPETFAPFGPSYLGTTLRYDARGNAERDTLDVEQVAARIVGHLIAGALPGLGIARLEDVTALGLTGLSTPILAPVDADAASSLIVDPMRAVAGRVREGIPEAPLPGAKPPRRRADGWTQHPDGRCTDKSGVPVTPGGFYLEPGEAEQFKPHPLMPGTEPRPIGGAAA